MLPSVSPEVWSWQPSRGWLGWYAGTEPHATQSWLLFQECWSSCSDRPSTFAKQRPRYGTVFHLLLCFCNLSIALLSKSSSIQTWMIAWRWCFSPCVQSCLLQYWSGNTMNCMWSVVRYETLKVSVFSISRLVDGISVLESLCFLLPSAIERTLYNMGLYEYKHKQCFRMKFELVSFFKNQLVGRHQNWCLIWTAGTFVCKMDFWLGQLQYFGEVVPLLSRFSMLRMMIYAWDWIHFMNSHCA